MMVRISGERDSIMQPPFMVSMNKSRSYPVKNVSDNIPRVPYHSGPKRVD